MQQAVLLLDAACLCILEKLQSEPLLSCLVADACAAATKKIKHNTTCCDSVARTMEI
jgi:hypothetical protein